MKDIKQEITIDLPNQSKVKQEITKPVIKEEEIEDQPPTNNSTSYNSTNIANKNKNFKPHNYGSTDFTKYHNQSKDVLYIAKRLQQVKLCKIL